MSTHTEIAPETRVKNGHTVIQKLRDDWLSCGREPMKTQQLQSRDFNHCTAEIEETVCLTCDEWDEFRQNLLAERTWLAGKGGCPERGVRSAILVVRPGATAADSIGFFVDPKATTTPATSASTPPPAAPTLSPTRRTYPTSMKQ